MMRLLSIALAWLIASAALADSEPFAVEREGLTLHGTLELPDADVKAIAVIIAGSGPTDRNGNSAVLPGSNNSLRYLAESLAERGIASVRYDKRLIGESVMPGLSETDLRFDHYADDAGAILRALRARFPGQLALLIGHSEGGHLALTAAPKTDVDAVVVVAGPGQHPADLIDQQLSAQIPPGDLLNSARQSLTQLRAGTLATDAPPQLAMLFRESVQPYLISWFAHDPAEQANQLNQPLLLLYGDKDVQVPLSDGRLLAEAQPKAKLVELAGMNHVLKVVGDDAALQQSSYADPDLPIDAQLIEAIDRWVTALLD